MKPGLALLIIAFAAPALAQSHSHGGGRADERPPASSVERSGARAAEEPRSFGGEVRGVDRVAGLVTLQHEAISVIDVPARTMEYAVKDPSMLERVNVGDRVRFTAVLQGRTLVVTKIVAGN